MNLRKLTALASLIVLATSAPILGQQTTPPPPAEVAAPPVVTPPDQYLGHPVGADFKLAGWDRITGYFELLAGASAALRVDTLGRTTRGQPFIAATVTSPENMQRLAEIRQQQARLADPRKLGEADLQALLQTQPAVVLIAHNIHATEIASSQGVMELAYQLVSDPELETMLRDVVVLLIPSVNPDGQQMVVEWYERTAGTPYEGSAMPWLYHDYVGHDNNRDFFMLTQVETRLLNDLLYASWYPEIVYDVHQMGSRGARFFVPPFSDPVNPNLDPLVIRQISLFGLQISTDLEAAGKAGVVNGQRFDLWWHGGLRTAPARHNMIGILSESASARLASPIFQEPDALRQPERGSNYPNPWPGGWWRLRDIVDYQLIAARSVISLAALQRRQLIRNYVEAGRRAINAGRTTPPYAYVVPAAQRDVATAATMLETLRRGGIEIHRATADFMADGVRHRTGDWVVLMAQPYRAHVKDLLERQVYPDRRLYPDGPPLTPYDASGWTLPLQMGVEVVEVRTDFTAQLSPEAGPIEPPPGRITGSGPAYVLAGANNATNRAIHRVLEAGGRALLVSEPLVDWPAGSVVLSGPGTLEILTDLAAREGLSGAAFAGPVTGYPLKRLRVGLYQPWTASMDEGWTRWVFDEWQVPYTTLHDAEIRSGQLNQRYDVIVVPDIAPGTIVEGRKPGTVPPEYVGGLGKPGIDAIRAFVKGGGTLVCLDSSAGFAIDVFDLRVRDSRPPFQEQRSGKAFYAPGSLLAVSIDTQHPLGFGMPERAAIYYANGPLFEIDKRARRTMSIATYGDDEQLLSGYALEPGYLSGKSALVEVGVDQGRVILFGFRPQHRGQTHGTFKLLFNALYRGAAAAPGPMEF